MDVMSPADPKCPLLSPRGRLSFNDRNNHKIEGENLLFPRRLLAESRDLNQTTNASLLSGQRRIVLLNYAIRNGMNTRCRK